MDHTDNLQEEEVLDFDLDDILNEFHSDPEGAAPEEPYAPEDMPGDFQEAPAPESAPVSGETMQFSLPQQEAPAVSAETLQFNLPQDPAQASPEELSQDMDLDSLMADADAAMMADAQGPDMNGDTLRMDAVSPAAEDGDQVFAMDPAMAPGMDGATIQMDGMMGEGFPDMQAPQEEMDPKLKLRELKRKLVAGPEKQYYALSEMGLGKLQVAILLNVIIVLLCAGAAVLFYMGMIPENRMRLLIFSQVLAMLVSALLGSHQMIDGISELLHGRFTVNTMMALTFLVCCLDSFFCLRDLRVPCCAAFSLEMTCALCARYQRRNEEMAQMDTLRKAVKLRSLVKVPGFYQNASGLLKAEGRLEDFWDVYDKSSGPRKLQSIYAFVSFLLCLAIAGLAGVMHGAAMGVQILATSMLVAVPASFFVALTRPAAILERRLHMVGAVLCGWQGVKGLTSNLVFPITDSDLFPHGSTKLNGVKFYSDRDPDMIISYTSSLILAAGGGLVPIFQQLMTSRGVAQNPVQNLHDYGTGGIGGEVCGENVLLGTYSFLQSMGVMIPDGSMVDQAVYAAINGQLCAVVAISYARMRSAAAGMVTICGYRKLTPVVTAGDFLLTEEYIRSKFEIRSRRLQFPDPETRQMLSSQVPAPDAPGLALVTRDDLASFAYAVTGARALRTSCSLGMALHLFGGILGMLIMLVLGILGSTELLTPMNVLLYQLVWMIPGLLITGWTRNV